MVKLFGLLNVSISEQLNLCGSSCANHFISRLPSPTPLPCGIKVKEVILENIWLKLHEMIFENIQYWLCTGVILQQSMIISSHYSCTTLALCLFLHGWGDVILQVTLHFTSLRSGAWCDPTHSSRT